MICLTKISFIMMLKRYMDPYTIKFLVKICMNLEKTGMGPS